MATINLSVGQNGYEAWMNVSETIPSDYITGNYTKVNVDLILKNGSKRTNTNGWTFLIQVNNSDAKRLTGQNLNSTVVSYHESYTVISVSGVNVPHNADGTKSVYIYGKLEKDYYGTYDPGFVGGGGNVTLTTIPRASAVSVSSDPTLGGNAVTISCSRASNDFHHTLRVINPDNIQPYNLEQFNDIQASKSWTPPLNDDYAKTIPRENRQFTISCETFNSNGASLGTKTCTTTIHVPNNSSTKPTLSTSSSNYSHYDVNDITRGWEVLVQSKSRLRFTVKPTANARASISSAQINIEGTTYSANASSGTSIVEMTKVLQNSGNNTIVKGNATDSRGFKAYDSSNISDWQTMETLIVLPYNTPEFVIQPVISRCSIENSSPKLDDLGEYIVMSYKGRISAVTSSSTHKNSSASLKIRWKTKSASSYGNNDYITVAGTYNSSSDDYIFEQTNVILAKNGTNINIGQSTEYMVKFELIDAFNDSSNPIYVEKQIGVGGDLLNFNASGKSIGIGQLSTAGPNETKLEVALDTTFKLWPKINGVSLLDLIYPIGSIYISVNSTNPGTLFGGTWTQLKDRFLIGAGSSYSAGGTGGASSVTLSTSNLPKHTHGVNITTSGGGHNHNQYFMEVRWASNYSGTKSLGRPQSVGSGNTNERATTSNGSHSHTVSGNTGDGGFSNSAFSIIPPYLAVYMWKRTG